MWLSHDLTQRPFPSKGGDGLDPFKAGTLLRPNFELYHMPEFPREPYKWTGTRADL